MLYAAALVKAVVALREVVSLVIEFVIIFGPCLLLQRVEAHMRVSVTGRRSFSISILSDDDGSFVLECFWLDSRVLILLLLRIEGMLLTAFMAYAVLELQLLQRRIAHRYVSLECLGLSLVDIYSGLRSHSVDFLRSFCGTTLPLLILSMVLFRMRNRVARSLLLLHNLQGALQLQVLLLQD